MSSILADEGIPENGVRTIIRSAARFGIIKDPQPWLSFAIARNKTSHLYHEGIAIAVANQIRAGFLAEVNALLLIADENLKQNI